MRTTNAIEAILATVRLRTKKIKSGGCRSVGRAMAYTLLVAAHRPGSPTVNAPHLVALVRAGAIFVDWIIVEREDWESAA